MQKQSLAALLHEADQMTQNLISLRNCIVGQSLSVRYKQPSSMIVEAAKNRLLLRTLAETLETNRNLVQINKQKIEKSRIVLEGLDYFKKTIKDKIQGYHTDVESIEEYFEEPFGPIDWENDYESGENRLKQSLEKLKSKDQKYRATIQHKNELQKKINQKNKLYNSVLPKQIKKLNEQVLQTTKLFGIETNELLQKIQNPQLSYIFDSLKTLRVAEKIDVFYDKEEYEYIDVIVKPIGMELYERCQQYKIKVEEKEMKIRITFPKPDFCKLVIVIDRRSDIANRDIFHRIINKQAAKPLFEEPSTQYQRNLNNKFVFVEWLEDILCASSIESSQFLALIRNRIFTTAFIKHVLDTIKHPVWLNLLCPVIFNEITHRKLIIESGNKISFQDYKQLVNIPTAVKKSLNAYQQQIRRPANSQNTSQGYQHLNHQKGKLLQILSKIGLQEILIQQIYQYYKLVISYSGLKIQCIVIIPYQYPEIQPKIKIISLERPGQEAAVNSMISIQCKAKIENKVSLNEETEILERQANSPFSMANQTGNQAFSLLYYLGKLFQSIYSLQTTHNERKKLK